jgi:hypothetical protein
MIGSFYWQSKTQVPLPLKEIVIICGSLTGMYLGFNVLDGYINRDKQ